MLNLTYANCRQLTSRVFSQFTLEIKNLLLRFALLLLFAMAGLCPLSAVTGVTCGSSRGFTDCVALNSCDGSISSHFQNHHLSRENVCGKDLILVRASLLELTEQQFKNMTVCVTHRITLGKYRQAPKT